MCKMDDTALRTLFNLYSNDINDEPDCERIGPHGLLHLLTDMKLDPIDRRVLLLACKLKAETQCEFSWQEWKEGLSNQRLVVIAEIRPPFCYLSNDASLKSVKDIRSMLDNMDANLTSFATFKEVYNFVFDYGKQAGQKHMLLDYAVQYWRILFKDTFVLIDLWEEFLHKEQIRGIAKDTWVLLLDFCFSVKPDLSDYDDDGSWPVLLDQFVEFVRSKK